MLGSLVSKTLFIQSLMFTKDIKIICITETWLNNSFYDQEILSNDYTIYRRDRGSRGGGVLIGISKDLPSKIYNTPVHNSVEQVTVELLTNPPTLLCCLYIPPNAPQIYYENTIQFITNLPDTQDLIILGDFNLPDIDWYSRTGSTHNSQDICSLFF